MPGVNAADTVRQLIERAGLSQRQAADAIGVSQRTFRDWGAGKSQPPRVVLLAVEALALRAELARK
jgi:DNA-binding transcriptional regulator YiaG